MQSLLSYLHSNCALVPFLPIYYCKNKCTCTYIKLVLDLNQSGLSATIQMAEL